MASLKRKPKYGNDWTVNDLAAYNITIAQQGAATFFGQTAFPLPSHHPDLLNNLTTDEMTDEASYRVVQYTDPAMYHIPDEESARFCHATSGRYGLCK